MRDYGWAWGTSLVWALVPSLAKMGLAQGFSPIAGTLVAMVVALAALSLLQVFSVKARRMLTVDRRSLVFVVGCGVGTGLAGITYFTALASGSVSLVTAITSGGQPIGSLILASFFLRHKERFGWPVVLGTVFIVAGIYLVTF